MKRPSRTSLRLSPMVTLVVALSGCARGGASSPMGGDTGTESEDDESTDDVADEADDSSGGEGSSDSSDGETDDDGTETGTTGGTGDTTTDTTATDTTGTDATGTDTTGTDSTGTGTTGTDTTGTDTTGTDTTGTDTTGTPTCDFELSYDFSDCGEWSHGLANGSSAASSWECGDPTAYTQGPGTGRTGIWSTNLSGDYNDAESSYLASPAFSLQECAGAPVGLVFEHWHNFEGGAVNADGGIVQVSVDGGTNWETVGSGDYYAGSPLTTEHQPPDGETGFSGLEANRTWRTSEADLTPYGGETNVIVRFVFGSNSATPRAGWYIDSVVITGQ